jgi:hypothetical protein
MVPLIRSRQLVTVAPVSAVDTAAGRVQISNNRGRVNGWTNHARIYGICTAVDGVRRG